MLRAVVDANVLFPAVLRDVVLEFAMHGLLQPLWTREILAETAASLIRANRKTKQGASRLVAELQRVFPGSNILGYEHQTQMNLCADPKDEHVLGAALHSKADALVTFNLKDFPSDLFESFGIELSHPDALLTNAFDTNPQASCQALGGLLGYYELPPKLAEDLAERLVRSQVPIFGQRILDSRETIDQFASHVRANLKRL